MDYLWFWFSKFLVDVGISGAILITAAIIMVVSTRPSTKGQ